MSLVLLVIVLRFGYRNTKRSKISIDNKVEGRNIKKVRLNLHL